jgi:dTDP-glucose 4,6-dehydratase
MAILRLLVTGGMGFIGSNFIRHMLSSHPEHHVINLDKLGYGSNLENLKEISSPNYQFCLGDITSVGNEIGANIDVIINFAAESHVDRSIANPRTFLENNAIGALHMLEMCRRNDIGFLQVSTDEVYGSSDGKRFNEDSRLNPTSPYAASKSAADLLVNAYHHTYGLSTRISRCTNNYGPCQSPEKFIPKTIIRASLEMPIPVYGSGRQIRDWIHVHDHCTALDQILRHGKDGEVYNIASGIQVENIDVVKNILDIIGKPHTLIQHVEDRPGHDDRYRVHAAKIYHLGWKPEVNFETGLKKTVEWYLQNKTWWENKIDTRILSTAPWEESW